MQATQLVKAAQKAPAAERNKGPIADVLAKHLPASGVVLEVASGTGQHVAHFGERFGQLEWQPSDVTDANFDSIRAWCAAVGASNVREPVLLDACWRQWPAAEVAAVINSNMIHISPWETCLGLLAGAARILQPGGLLYLYGPYKVGGEHTAESNARFDASLQARHPDWGVRDLEAVVAAAEQEGLRFIERVAMPANNLSVIFRAPS